MTAARRCPQTAPDHPSPHVPPDPPCPRNLGDVPSLQEPGDVDASPERGAPGERAIYDPETRAYHDAETGELLADMAAWERASDKGRERARARLAAVRLAEDLIAAGLRRRDADGAAAAEAGASASAVSRWRRKASRLPKGARVAGLLPAKRPGRPSKVDAAMAATLESLALRRGAHLTSRAAHKALLAEHGRAPAHSTVREWLRNWRRKNWRELAAVTNPDLDRSRHKPAGGDASASITRLNQLWELDSTPADVMCSDGKRYTIVAAIDVWSRRTRLLVVPSSRAIAIALLLRRCILEWGVPEAVRTDEGKDYTSKHLVGALADLEIEHLRCPPYSPERKPHIERFLGTLARELFPELPGFTGHDVAQAQALRARKSFAERRGASDAEVFGAALTAEALQARCDVWCEAVYGRRSHSGLGGASPFERITSWQGMVRRIHDERALDALLAEPAGDGWRTVCKKGIRLDCVFYIAGPLGSLVGERVKLRRDPADPGRIHVYREDGTFVCVAENPARTGADQAAIAAAMTADYREHRKAARKRARDLAQRTDPDGIADRALAKAATDAAGVVAFPKPGRAHQTPALAQAGLAAKAADKTGEAKAPQAATGMSPALAAAGALFAKDEEWA